jgi:hypothetical protein
MTHLDENERGRTALEVLNETGLTGDVKDPAFLKAVDEILSLDFNRMLASELTGDVDAYEEARLSPVPDDSNAEGGRFLRRYSENDPAEYDWLAEEEWTEDGTVTFASGTSQEPARRVVDGSRRDDVEKGASLATGRLLASLEERRRHASLAIRAVRVLSQECIDLQGKRGPTTLALGLETISNGAVDAIFLSEGVDRTLRRGFLLATMKPFKDDPAMHDLDVLAAAQRLTFRLETRLIEVLQEANALR